MCAGRRNRALDVCECKRMRGRRKGRRRLPRLEGWRHDAISTRAKSNEAVFDIIFQVKQLGFKPDAQN